MSRPRQTSSNLRNIALVIFVLLVAFVAMMLLYRGCEDPETSSTLLGSASPTPSTSSKSPTPTTSAERSATNANTTTAEANKHVVTVITGAVKKDGSGDVVNGAVVVLFKTDTRGADPQIVDDEGRFRFDVAIKPGITYSLQTKTPGLCGEESFTSDAISAQTINKNLVLRPCQSQAPVVSSTKPEETDLTPISQGLGGMVAPLNSIKLWLQILATAWILTLVMLLVTTLGLVFFGRQQLDRNRIRISALEERAQAFDSKVARQDQPVEPPTTLLRVPTEFSQSVQQLISVVTQLATKTQKREDNRSHSAPTEVAPPPHVVHVARPFHEAKLTSAMPDPGNWYQNLLRGEVTLPLPLFAEINSTRTNLSPFAEKQRICFDEQSNHGPFVIMNSDDGIGWIFPTPGANFSPDHHRVFQELDPNNFEQQKLSITPREIIYQDGCWQLVL